MNFLFHRPVRLGLAFLFLLLWGPLVITIDGLLDNLHEADVAVVLGNKVETDGTPSPALKARLDHTIDLYREGYFKFILVSGAHGKEGYDETAVMRSYLEGHGIPFMVIFEDREGRTTWDTAENTAQFLSEHQLHSVLIVSQYFHMPRCRLAFSRFGIAPIYWSHAPLWSLRDFYSVPREVVGCIDYYFRKIDQPLTIMATTAPSHGTHMWRSTATIRSLRDSGARACAGYLRNRAAATVIDRRYS